MLGILEMSILLLDFGQTFSECANFVFTHSCQRTEIFQHLVNEFKVSWSEVEVKKIADKQPVLLGYTSVFSLQKGFLVYNNLYTYLINMQPLLVNESQMVKSSCWIISE